MSVYLQDAVLGLGELKCYNKDSVNKIFVEVDIYWTRWKCAGF